MTTNYPFDRFPLELLRPGGTAADALGHYTFAGSCRARMFCGRDGFVEVGMAMQTCGISKTSGMSGPGTRVYADWRARIES